MINALAPTCVSYCYHSMGQIEGSMICCIAGWGKQGGSDIFAVQNCLYLSFPLQLTVVCNSHVMLLSPSFFQR